MANDGHAITYTYAHTLKNLNFTFTAKNVANRNPLSLVFSCYCSQSWIITFHGRKDSNSIVAGKTLTGYREIQFVITLVLLQKNFSLVLFGTE